MPDLSKTFNPDSVATNSDAASQAQSEANTASAAAASAVSAASDAGSKASVASVAAAAVSDAASDAGSKATVALSKASDASVAAAGVASQASDASSAAVVAQSKASDASSAAIVAMSKASDASSAAVVAQSKASDASSAAIVANKRTVVWKPYHHASAISAGDGAMYFAIPNALNGMNLSSIGGHLYTAATSGVVEVQIANVTSGVDMLTSKLTWDATEKDTNTATSAAVINASADGVAVAEELRLDIDSAASGAKGMELRLTFANP